MQQEFFYGIDCLTIANALAIAAGTQKGVLNNTAITNIQKSQQYVQQIVENNKTVYGINTGFGVLATTPVSEEDTRILQHKILQSHSVGVGNPIATEIAKLMLLTKVHALAKGYSGVQLTTLHQTIICALHKFCLHLLKMLRSAVEDGCQRPGNRVIRKSS